MDIHHLRVEKPLKLRLASSSFNTAAQKSGVQVDLMMRLSHVGLRLPINIFVPDIAECRFKEHFAFVTVTTYALFQRASALSTSIIPTIHSAISPSSYWFDNGHLTSH
jgi:hypothetical protein